MADAISWGDVRIAAVIDWAGEVPDAAVFTGDLFHSPLQVIEPHWASCYDEQTPTAEASRRRVLSLAADTAALVLPAHLPRARALLIDRHAAGFQIARWLVPRADGSGPATEDP